MHRHAYWALAIVMLLFLAPAQAHHGWVGGETIE